MSEEVRRIKFETQMITYEQTIALYVPCKINRPEKARRNRGRS